MINKEQLKEIQLLNELFKGSFNKASDEDLVTKSKLKELVALIADAIDNIQTAIDEYDKKIIFEEDFNQKVFGWGNHRVLAKKAT